MEKLDYGELVRQYRKNGASVQQASDYAASVLRGAEINEASDRADAVYAQTLARAVNGHDFEGALNLSQECTKRKVTAIRELLIKNRAFKTLAETYKTSDPTGVPLLWLAMQLGGDY